jgi:hypothetical protein
MQVCEICVGICTFVRSSYMQDWPGPYINIYTPCIYLYGNPIYGSG